MRIFKKPLLHTIIFLSFSIQVNAGVNQDLILSETIPQQLSAYGFFKDMTNQIPAENVHPYSLSNPLFSDYSDKLRFVYIPEGKKLGYEKDKVFLFPVGSILIKTFAYLNTNGSLNPQLLETRLLIHANSGWKTISYIWNKEQTDAKRTIAGATIPTSFVNSEGEIVDVRYRAPNQNQCKECHQINKAIIPIGPKVRNMNKLVQYKNNEMNQILYWAAQGWIDQSYDENYIQSYLNEDVLLEDRARAYLDINCGHCHIPGGSADTTGLYLNLTENSKEKLGIFKKPVAAGRASGNLRYSIVPGHADESILLYRMLSLDPGIMMPESGRALSDAEGILLIEKWINQL